MKRILLLGALLMCLQTNAQSSKKENVSDYEKSSSELLDRSEYYGLSPDQKNKIIERKKTIGWEYAAIGRDRSLNGREKGQKKRALSESFRNDINAILNESQITKWNSQSTYKYHQNIAKEKIEYKLEVLELEYDKDIKLIEHQYKKDSYTQKIKKNERKQVYKQAKAELKRIKDTL